jgi:hypothetical protein
MPLVSKLENSNITKGDLNMGEEPTSEMLHVLNILQTVDNIKC